VLLLGLLALQDVLSIMIQVSTKFQKRNIILLQLGLTFLLLVVLLMLGPMDLHLLSVLVLQLIGLIDHLVLLLPIPEILLQFEVILSGMSTLLEIAL
jgi:hypothetical protein